MEVSGLNEPRFVQNSQERGSSARRKKDSLDNNSATAVTFQKTEISVEYATYRVDNSRDARDTGTKVEGTTVTLSDTAQVVQLKEQIHAEVLEQVKEFLGQYFTENPEAVEQVSRGEIPEYFNVENTARRILMIYMQHYSEGEDRQAFVDRAKGIINQAYGDVEGMAGTLPEIVIKTREFIMALLEKFAAGEDISEFMGIEIGRSGGQ